MESLLLWLDAVQWLKEQLDLPYTLHKARCVHADRTMRLQFPGAPVPKHLQGRVTAADDLPRLEFLPAAEEQGEEEGQQQIREVAVFVVQRLHAELYAELLESLRPHPLP